MHADEKNVRIDEVELYVPTVPPQDVNRHCGVGVMRAHRVILTAASDDDRSNELRRHHAGQKQVLFVDPASDLVLKTALPQGLQHASFSFTKACDLQYTIIVV